MNAVNTVCFCSFGHRAKDLTDCPECLAERHLIPLIMEFHGSVLPKIIKHVHKLIKTGSVYVFTKVPIYDVSLMPEEIPTGGTIVRRVPEFIR